MPSIFKVKKAVCYASDGKIISLKVGDEIPETHPLFGAFGPGDLEKIREEVGPAPKAAPKPEPMPKPEPEPEPIKDPEPVTAPIPHEEQYQRAQEIRATNEKKAKKTTGRR